MVDPDFYAILGVAPDADAEQIRAAFRQLARTLHPDAAGATGHESGPESGPELLTQVMAAWRVLHDPAKRAAYDRFRTRTRATSDAAAWPSPGALEHTNSRPERGQPPLIAGPTVIHSRTTPPAGAHIRVGPTIRLRD